MIEPGGTGLGPHVRDQQPSNAPSLRFVGDGQQVEFRRGENEGVEPQDPASMLVGVDGYEGAASM